MCLCIDTDFSQCILEIAIIRRWDTRFANPILSTVTFLPSSGVKILTLRALLRDLVCSLSNTNLYLFESSLSPSPRFKLPNTPMAFQRLELPAILHPAMYQTCLPLRWNHSNSEAYAYTFVAPPKNDDRARTNLGVTCFALKPRLIT
jgi:hypothetical protein